MHLDIRKSFVLGSILTAIYLSSPGNAQLLDLNSLQAFYPAHSPEEIAILAVDQSPQNLTSPSNIKNAETTPNQAYSFSAQQESDTSGEPQQLRKRSGACGSYTDCSQLGAPSLCCAPGRVCSADYLGRVGCCPSGAACTGAIPGAGGIVASTTTSSYYSASMASTPATTTGSTTTVSPSEGGFVIAGSSTVAILGSSGESLEVPLALLSIAGLVQLFGFW